VAVITTWHTCCSTASRSRLVCRTDKPAGSDNVGNNVENHITSSVCYPVMIIGKHYW
jgi:hypothetical protein